MRPGRNLERELVEYLGHGGVATDAQLRRQGLWSAAERLGLPTLTLDLTLNGTGTTRPYTVVALDAGRLDRTRTSARRLGHEITTTELVSRRALPAGLEWRSFSGVSSGGRDSVPDLCIWDPHRTGRSLGTVALVELDVGYEQARLEKKLAGAVSTSTGDRLGYILGTTLKGRVAPFIEMAASLADDLPRLAWVEAWWLDVSGVTDRYQLDRPSRSRVAKVTFSCWEREPGARLPESGPRMH